MNKSIERKLTKDYILSLISQEELFALYLSKLDNTIDLTTVEMCILTNSKIRNPLRNDNNPSLGFKYVNKNKLRARDFTGFFHGDIFDLVGYMYTYDTTKAQGFYLILKQIYSDVMKLETLDDFKPKALNITEVQSKVTILEPTIRNWKDVDYEYWSKFGITFDTLNKFKVYPIDTLKINPHINDSLFYRFAMSNPAYGYFEGYDNSIAGWRIYFPKTMGAYPKFITNFAKIQGLNMYDPSASVLIIVKALKDIMTMYEFLNAHYPSLSVTFIAPPSENHIFNDTEIRWFVNNHVKTFVLYDFDYTGVKFANYLKKMYHIEPLFITNGRFNTNNYNVKDIAELRSKGRISTMFSLFNQVLNNLKNEREE